MTFSGTKHWVSEALWHEEDGNLVVATDYEGCVAVYDIRSSFPLHSVPRVHERKILSACWKSATRLLTGGEDAKLKQVEMK